VQPSQSVRGTEVQCLTCPTPFSARRQELGPLHYKRSLLCRGGFFWRHYVLISEPSKICVASLRHSIKLSARRPNIKFELVVDPRASAPKHGFAIAERYAEILRLRSEAAGTGPEP
jgi:hypothetical protein